MTRYGSEHKAKTRLRVVKAAAREIRQKGPSNVAVKDVMANVGLTHGGFYAHFASKEELVAEAVDAMFADVQRGAPRLDKNVVSDLSAARQSLHDFLASYISTEHRDRPDRGCPLPTLSADFARNPGEAQARYVIGLEKLTEKIAASLHNIGIAEADCEADAVVSQMVGAVALARAIGSNPQSDGILRHTLNSLIMRLGL